MISLIILIFFLLLLTISCLVLNKHQVLTPQFGYIVFFLIQAIYAIGFVDEWSINLSLNTLLVIIGGAVIFLSVSQLTKKLYYRMHVTQRKKLKIRHDEMTNAIRIPKWFIISFMMLQLLTLFLLIYNMSKIGSGNLASLISTYRKVNLFTEESISFPGYVMKLRSISKASGYVWTYVVVTNIIYKNKKNIVYLIINIILSMLNGVLTGGRGPAVSMAFSAMVQYYIVLNKKDGWCHQLKLKTIVKVSILSVAVGILFAKSSALIGRTMKQGFAEYIAIYLSAELKNLDIFVRRGVFGTAPDNWQTLINAVNFLGRHGFSNLVHTFDLPYKNVNGHSLGNVYTAYYAYLYDGGIVGLIVFTSIMAAISQVCYCRAIEWKYKSVGKLDLTVILFSCMYYSISFSFFSNKFYEIVFNIEFIKYIVIWLVMDVIIRKVKIKFTIKNKNTK